MSGDPTTQARLYAELVQRLTGRTVPIEVIVVPRAPEQPEPLTPSVADYYAQLPAQED